MPGPRTIDSGSPDFADAIAAATTARHNAAAAIESRQLARFYSGARHGIGHAEAEARVGLMLASSLRALHDEQRALRRLNAVLLHAGGSVGDEFLVGRGLYRATRPGQLATYLGEQVPGYDEIVAAFEPVEVPDDRDEDMAAYQGLVRFPH